MLPKGEDAVSIDFEDFSMDGVDDPDGNSAHEETAAIFGLILARKISMGARSKNSVNCYVTDDSFLDGTHEKEAAVAMRGDGVTVASENDVLRGFSLEKEEDKLLLVGGAQDLALVDLPLDLL